MDPAGTMIRMEQEPGSSGVTVIDMYAREVLMGWDFKGLKSTGKKTERAKPWSSYVEKGYVSLTRGPWNNDYINEHVVFPQSSVHDDQVDASSGAFGELAPPVGWAYDVDYLQTFIKPHTHAH